MPGFKLLTALDPPTCLKIAWRTAQNLGYELTPIDDHSRRFTATRGSLVGALFGLGLGAPHQLVELRLELSWRQLGERGKVDRLLKLPSR